jgi:probable rRNA maturation factor
MVEVIFQKRISRFPTLVFTSVFETILSSLVSGSPSVTILFSDDTQIQKLNRVFRKKNKPTDVLAFAAQEGQPFKGQENYLGDIIISVTRAKIQARMHSKGLADELFTLAVHGLLHLLGYDHEAGLKKRLEMESLEKDIHTRYGPALGTLKT